MSAITHLIAGVPVSDLDRSLDWYARPFGREPDVRAGDEILWDVDEHATLFIEPDAARAGAGRVTFVVAGIDALLERLAGEGIARTSRSRRTPTASGTRWCRTRTATRSRSPSRRTHPSPTPPDVAGAAIRRLRRPARRRTPRRSRADPR